ncbi:hypothetical protein [Rhizobium oryzicola]|uniref:LysE family translocator n=1 Tax=Rhizobium oryzicola TaxID=1232668 RepID=A0ABT8T2W0_9HYPH|nr:hypothetical protein [Rhizobium oryzicola]MDO1584511.1 hypothetical protein [Rhizobium oryzicola]
MSADTLLVLSALALLAFLLPSPAGRMLLDYALSFGRARAAVLSLSIGLAYSVTVTAALLIWLAIGQAPAAIIAVARWMGVGYLVLYLLWSLQQRVSLRIADNDNLPVRAMSHAAVQLPRHALRLKLVLALVSLLLQSLDSTVTDIASLIPLLTVMAVSGFVAPLIQTLSAERVARRIRLIQKQNPTWHKPRTRFIARRAVTAGYRQIAA